MERYLKINCDGGARGNPGPAAAAFVIQDSAGNLHLKRGKYLGVATNNEAEYQAVIEALGWVGRVKQVEHVKQVEFFLDSTLVVNQLNGKFKVKNGRLRELLTKVRMLERGINITYIYVPRAQNAEADRLVNETLDGTAEMVLQ